MSSPSTSTSLLTISPSTARRLAISRQRLEGPLPSITNGPDAILGVVRDLGCLQIDPISAVARTQLLVLWSRLGCYDPADLDKALFDEKTLFEYWAHAASIVLTEEYPIHDWLMRRYRSGGSKWARQVSDWLEENRDLKEHVLSELRTRGPLLSRDIQDKAQEGWRSTGWTNDRNVSRMLDFLLTRGEIMVAGRRGLQKLWDLAERCLPEWTPREELSDMEVSRRAAQKSLRALGVARSRDIMQHYTRGRYPHIAKVLAELESEGSIQQVQVAEDGNIWPGTWYIDSEDLSLLERIEKGDWQSRTTLLSPFDNLICDRARTELLFDFYFRIEIYVPKAQRQYGYYVLSILHGDRLIGRVDPTMDRKRKRLTINAVFAEPGVSMNGETGAAVRSAIENLASFLGARDIDYAGAMPEGW